jgi:hypothetical protein
MKIASLFASLMDGITNERNRFVHNKASTINSIANS